MVFPAPEADRYEPRGTDKKMDLNIGTLLNGPGTWAWATFSDSGPHSRIASQNLGYKALFILTF